MHHSLLPRRFSLKTFHPSLAICAILVLGSFVSSQAQRPRTIAVSIDFAQGCISYEGGVSEMWADSTKWDGAQLWYVPVGKHNLRIVANKSLSLSVKEIKYDDWQDNPDGSSTPKSQKFDSPPETGVSIDVYPKGAGYVSPASLKITLACSPIEQKRVPIVFLPGVGGTQLIDPNPSGLSKLFSNEVWVFSTFGQPGAVLDKVNPFGAADYDEPRFKLKFNQDGVDDAKANIQTGTVLRSGLANFYGETLSFLKTKGYQEENDLFTLPYDWRLDNADHFGKLDQLIDTALKKTGATKVILLAHSMGGLIARAYLISSPQRAANVDALVTMASPCWGSPKPFYAAADGYTFGNPTVSQPTMKYLSQNWPALYQLMPRIPFIKAESGAYLSLEESRTIKYKELLWVGTQWAQPGSNVSGQQTGDNPWALNDTLVKRAEMFYAPLGPKQNPTRLPVKFYVIIGQGVRTLTGYTMRAPERRDFPLLGGLERYVDIAGRKAVLEPVFDDGDGTVPLWSAEIEGPTQTYYVQYEDKWIGSDISTEHSKVPSNPTVLSIVDQILQGKPPLSSQHPKKRVDLYVADANETVDLIIHSDAHLNVMDQSGRRLGYNSIGGFYETLTSGSFLSINGYEYASFNNLAKNYRVLLNGVIEGKVSLFVNISKAGRMVNQFSYPEVPVKPGTMAQLDLVPSQAASRPPDLVVTTDGQTTTIPARTGGIPGTTTPQGGGPGTPTGPTKPTPPSSQGIGGSWTALTGEIIELIQTGNRITGRYRGILGTGEITGTFDGKNLSASLRPNEGLIPIAVPLTLTLLDDGKLAGQLDTPLSPTSLIFTRTRR